MLVSVDTMGTVLEEYTTEDQRSVVRFCEQNSQCKGYPYGNVSFLVCEVFVA
jgi:hypothetical protein